MPYRLVIRSGSGWVPARQYFDKHYFANYTRSRLQKETAFQHLTSTSTNNQRVGRQRPAAQNTTHASVAQSAPMVANSTANSQTNTQSAGLTSLMSNNGIIHLAPSSSQVSVVNYSLPDHPEFTGVFPSAKGSITISPLFRLFSRLPQELQDEILYQAVGYTRVISLSQGTQSSPTSTSPITITGLFQISKSINEHMVPHIFRSSNFHFGVTGFTKFLWQVGPFNRSDIRHLTFHFSKVSLLHCIRWMAPDPVWELFEPPVATNPPTLMYFWRCQLQDLMKELNLSTLTIDIRDVPLADVPMLVRIFTTALGSVKRIRVIDSYVRPDNSIGEFTQDLCVRLPNMPHFTWRDMSLQYHNDYKYQRWHMKHILALRDVNLCPILEAWMNKDKDFFDS